MTRLVTPLTLLTITGAAGPAADYQNSRRRDGTGSPSASALQSVLSYQASIKVEIVKKPNTFGNLSFRFTKDGKEAFTMEGSYATTSSARDSILYYADYHRPRRVVRCCLRPGEQKELWKTSVKGLGPIAHFKYSTASKWNWRAKR